LSLLFGECGLVCFAALDTPRSSKASRLYSHAPPNTLDKSDKDVIITFMIVFLSPNYVNNPFLKAKFMSVGVTELMDHYELHFDGSLF
jgi:hypothetical protein